MLPAETSESPITPHFQGDRRRCLEECHQNALMQLKDLQEEQLRELRNLQQLQLQVTALGPRGLLAEDSQFLPEPDSDVEGGLGDRATRLLASGSEENISITVGEVQRSLAIDRTRKQEELRTLRLAQRLRRAAGGSAGSPSRSGKGVSTPVKRSEPRSPSPGRPLYDLPPGPRKGRTESPSPAPRRSLSVEISQRLGSVALAAAAEHWGLPHERKVSASPRRPRGASPAPRPAVKAPRNPRGAGPVLGDSSSALKGLGLSRGPSSPVRACHSLWRPPVNGT